MITLEDCIALCGLTEQEVMAIAEHEHVPEIAAAAIGRYLLNGAVPRRTSGNHADLQCPPVPQPDPQPEPQEPPVPPTTPSAGSTFRNEVSPAHRLEAVRDMIHAVVQDAQP